MTEEFDRSKIQREKDVCLPLKLDSGVTESKSINFKDSELYGIKITSLYSDVE